MLMYVKRQKLDSSIPAVNTQITEHVRTAFEFKPKYCVCVCVCVCVEGAEKEEHTAVSQQGPLGSPSTMRQPRIFKNHKNQSAVT